MFVFRFTAKTSSLRIALLTSNRFRLIAADATVRASRSFLAFAIRLVSNVAVRRINTSKVSRTSFALMVGAVFLFSTFRDFDGAWRGSGSAGGLSSAS
jgi:hypothetical protein